MATIRLYANLREIFGNNELIVDGSTIEEILIKLENLGGKSYNNLMKDDFGADRGNIIILLNGKNIRFMDGIKTKVNGGDIIDLFPPVAGG